jgi:hypothetical protein
MQLKFLLPLVAFSLFSGCKEQPSPIFLDSDKTQYSIVSIPQGYVGGGGDPVMSTGGEVYFQGLPVLVADHKTQSQILAKAGKQPPKNTPGTIKIEARFHLEPGSTRISTNPPSSRSIYRLVIDELVEAHW